MNDVTPVLATAVVERLSNRVLELEAENERLRHACLQGVRLLDRLLRWDSVDYRVIQHVMIMLDKAAFAPPAAGGENTNNDHEHRPT